MTPSHTNDGSALQPVTGFLQTFAGPAYKSSIYLARKACLTLFNKLNQPEAQGLLQITEQDGSVQRFGDPVSKRSFQSNDASVKPLRKGDPQLQKAFAHIEIKDDIFWIRLALGNDLGFAESFMLAEIQTSDLHSCFKLFIDNRAILSDFSFGIVSKITSSVQSLLNRRYANTKAGSLRNIGAHYDISNQMYEAFLSNDMTYSCAVFPTLDADITGPLLASVQHRSRENNPEAPETNGHSLTNGARSESGRLRPLRYESRAQTPNGIQQNSQLNGANENNYHALSGAPLNVPDELEDGQLRKIHLHLDRASLHSQHRVLEIGTGWGSLAIEAVKSSGCRIDSLTLSVEQKILAEKRIANAGLTDRIKVHLMDYRDMPHQWTDQFDRVISIEMIEAVGIEFLPTFFASIDRVLRRKGGVCVLQAITMPEERFEAYVDSVDFIKKWIFPGGVLPSVTSLISAATNSSQGSLILDSVNSIGPHYARTLREWRDRFEKNFDDRIAPALLRDHGEIKSLPFDEQKKQIQIFKRKWLYYFIYCEVGFTERVIGNHILSFTRSGNKTLPVCCI